MEWLEGNESLYQDAASSVVMHERDYASLLMTSGIAIAGRYEPVVCSDMHIAGGGDLPQMDKNGVLQTPRVAGGCSCGTCMGTAHAHFGVGRAASDIM